MDNKLTNTTSETFLQRIMVKIKNPQFYGFCISVAILAIISFLYFYPDVVQGNELRQYDMQQGAANGQETKEYFEETGEKSMWTNSLFSGMPTFQISPSYESNNLFSWINDIMGLGLPSPANLLFMMMAGFLILMMAFKVRWYIALIGAVAYGFSSYFIIIIGAGHIWKFITLAYIPPTIAGIVLCYRGRYLLGGAITALFAMMQIASNHVQMSYYFLFVIFGLVVAYLIILLRKKAFKQWGISTIALTIAGVLAITANLPNLYNTYAYSKETMRGKHSELTAPQSTAKNSGDGLDKDYIMAYSYTPSETFSLLIPNVKGGATTKPEQGQHKPLTLYDLPKTQELINKGEIYPQDASNLQVFFQYFGAPEGTNGPVYVGAIIVALFLLGCIIVRGPIKWVLIVLTILSIFLAWGRYMEWFSSLFIDYFPMYNKFRTVESILVIAQFTMPLLGILALHKLFTTPNSVNRYKLSIYISFGIVAFICLLGTIFPGIFGSYLGEGEQGYIAEGIDKQYPTLFSAVETLRYSMVRGDAFRSLLFVIAGGGCAILMLNGKKSISIGACAMLFVLVLGDMYSVNKRYLNHDSFCTPELTQADPFPLRQVDRQILSDTTMNYRVLDLQNFGSPAPSYHHKMVGGYHAAKLTRYQDMIDRHIGRLSSEADINVLNMLNTKYIISDANTVDINPGALGNAWWVNEIKYYSTPDEEMAALDVINPATTAVADAKFKNILGTELPQPSPNDTVFETTYAPNRLTYHANSDNGGIIVFSEVYFPWGWKATIDGNHAEIGRVNYILRALRVPAGSHTIEMVFDPDSIHNTVNAARIAIILIYIALFGALIMAVIKPQPKIEENESY